MNGTVALPSSREMTASTCGGRTLSSSARRWAMDVICRSSHFETQPHHCTPQILGPDCHEQLPVRHRDTEGDTPVEARDEGAYERAINRVQLQPVRLMNRFAGKPVEEL